MTVLINLVMDLSGRPRLADFESRMGETFRVETVRGVAVGDWRLERCEELPRPPLQELAQVDCFALTFACGRSSDQGHYRVMAPDGFSALLFAVPIENDGMHVTIN